MINQIVAEVILGAFYLIFLSLVNHFFGFESAIIIGLALILSRPSLKRSGNEN